MFNSATPRLFRELRWLPAGSDRIGTLGKSHCLRPEAHFLPGKRFLLVTPWKLPSFPTLSFSNFAVCLFGSSKTRVHELSARRARPAWQTAGRVALLSRAPPTRSFKPGRQALCRHVVVCAPSRLLLGLESWSRQLRRRLGGLFSPTFVRVPFVFVCVFL